MNKHKDFVCPINKQPYVVTGLVSPQLLIPADQQGFIVQPTEMSSARARDEAHLRD